jgi:hypothetical protein
MNHGPGPANPKVARRLRARSFAAGATSVVAGVVSFIAAPYAPTPVLDIAERISIGAFLLWIAVLAVVLWRTPVEAADAHQRVCDRDPVAGTRLRE